MSMTDFDTSIDPGVDANRDSIKVFRYRVRAHDLYHGDTIKIRGKRHQPGDSILLRGHAAYREAPYRLSLVDPEPIKQTEDPATWEAQSATSLHVYLNGSLAIHHDNPRVRAHYAGPEGIARISLTFDCTEWSVGSYLTLADAQRIHSEISEAISEMKERMFRNPVFDDDCNEIEDGDLYIHHMGGSL